MAAAGGGRGTKRAVEGSSAAAPAAKVARTSGVPPLSTDDVDTARVRALNGVKLETAVGRGAVVYCACHVSPSIRQERHAAPHGCRDVAGAAGAGQLGTVVCSPAC